MYACAAKQSNSCAFLAPTGLSIETSPRFITQGNSYIWTEACRAPYQLLLTQRYEGFIYSFNCFLHHTKHIFPIFTGTIKPDTSHTESPHLQHMWKYISNDIICHSDSVLHIRFKDTAWNYERHLLLHAAAAALSVWELVKRDPQQQHLMGPNMFFLSDSYYPILNFSSHSANKTQESYFVPTPPPPPPLFIDVTLWHNSVSVVKIYQAAIHIQNTSFLLPNTRLHWCYETLNPLYTLYVAPAKLKKTSLLSGKY